MDPRIATIARRYFDPEAWHSGTGQMAPLLHALIRMTRPRTVVEYGTGFTTLFLLQALADSVADFAAEREAFVAKTQAAGILDRDPAGVTFKDAAFRAWFGGGGRASTLDPAYYREPYTPHLYCFENHPPDHPYVAALRDAVAEAALGHLFSLHDGETASVEALPPEALPIDLVWWDFPGLARCYKLFWPALNPAGGTLIFHDVASGFGRANWDAFQLITDGRHPDMEAIVLAQPNKLDQNSCAIIRKKTTFAPPYERARITTQLEHARALVDEPQSHVGHSSER